MFIALYDSQSYHLSIIGDVMGMFILAKHGFENSTVIQTWTQQSHLWSRCEILSQPVNTLA